MLILKFINLLNYIYKSLLFFKLLTQARNKRKRIRGSLCLRTDVFLKNSNEI